MRKMSIKAIGMSVIFLTLVMCTGSPHSPKPIPTYFNIQGTVTDARGGAPLAGAIVRLWAAFQDGEPCSWTTNDQGYYLIKDCAIDNPGTGDFVFLEAECNGYQAKRGINPAVTSALQTINIALDLLPY